MNPILAIAVLICIVGLGEIISVKSKATISTMLFVGVFLLIAFWLGLPKDIYPASGIFSVAGICVGLLLTHMGTLLNFNELKAQWKTVIIGFSAAIFIIIFINLLGPIIIDKTMALASSPIVAGGVVAQLAVSGVMQQKGLLEVEIFCLLVLVLQSLAGIPVASIILKKEARRFVESGDIKNYLVKENTMALTKEREKLIPPLPIAYQKPAVLLGKAAIVTYLGFYLSGLTGGTVNNLLLCMILGVIFTEIGFLESNILDKAKASGIVLIFITLVVFSSISKATPDMVLKMIVPVVIVIVLGIIGIIVSGYLTGKILKVAPMMAIAIGLTALFGFPATYYISKEVSEAMSNNEEEREALELYILPKMVTAGFATVTIASVIIVGFVVNML